MSGDIVGHVDFDLPENGWLVSCMGLNLFVFVTRDLDALARVVVNVIDQAETDAQKNNTNRMPVQVHELGREMNVGLRSVVTKLEPVKR